MLSLFLIAIITIFESIVRFNFQSLTETASQRGFTCLLIQLSHPLLHDIDFKVLSKTRICFLGYNYIVREYQCRSQRRLCVVLATSLLQKLSTYSSSSWCLPSHRDSAQKLAKTKKPTKPRRISLLLNDFRANSVKTRLACSTASRVRAMFALAPINCSRCRPICSRVEFPIRSVSIVRLWYGNDLWREFVSNVVGDELQKSRMLTKSQCFLHLHKYLRQRFPKHTFGTSN